MGTILHNTVSPDTHPLQADTKNHLFYIHIPIKQNLGTENAVAYSIDSAAQLTVKSRIRIPGLDGKRREQPGEAGRLVMKRGLLILLCGVFGVARQALALTGEGAVTLLSEPVVLLCVGLGMIGLAGILRSRQEKRAGGDHGVSPAVKPLPDRSPA